MSWLERTNFRTRVFFSVFALACLLGLAYVFLRPAVYVSSARLQIEMLRSPLAGSESDNTLNLLNVAQALTSRAVLDSVVEQLRGSASGMSGLPASAEELRRMLIVMRFPGTNIVELQGEGSRRELMPLILEAWIDAFRRSQSDARNQSSTDRKSTPLNS